MKKVFTIILHLFSTITFAQTVSKYIVTDQFGYRPNDQKIAILRDPQTGFDAAESYTPSVNYSIVNTVSNSVVFTGSAVAWKSGAIDTHSGDKVWHFDFSSVTTPGTYYVLDVDKNVKSYSFEIKEDVYNEVLKHAVRTFFYQRANFAKNEPFAEKGWVDGASHVKPKQQKNCRYYLDTNNVALHKDLTGGWFDAGDYYKYTPWTSGYILMMLKAYNDNPTVWTDNYNLPESGNNIPDLLDEVKYGMDYLLKLQNTDGGSISLVSGTGGTPPSSATARCLYGKVTTAASLKSASAFAMGAKVFRMIGLNCYADSLQVAAEKAWVWSKNNPAVYWDNANDLQWKAALTEKSGSPGWPGGSIASDLNMVTMFRVEASCYLFDLTSTAEYKTYFDANYNTKSNFIAYTWLNPYEHDYQEALLYYTTILGATPAVVTNIKNITLSASTKAPVGGLLFGAYDAKYDGYMTFMKDYTWGSNAHKCTIGLMFYEMMKYGINPSRNADAMVASKNFIHYIHGLNALSKNYLSNMNSYGADNSVTEFYHSWFKDDSPLWDKVGVSTYGPAPGFLVGGPNANYKGASSCCKTSTCGSPELNTKCTAIDVSQIVGQPFQKSYTDFNTDYQLQSWEITENSCGYQVAYIRLLSQFAKKQGTQPNLNKNCTTTGIQNEKVYPIQIYPNPSENGFNVICNNQFVYDIFNVDGKMVESNTGIDNIEIGKNLNRGVYIVRIKQGETVNSFKIIKL